MFFLWRDGTACAFIKIVMIAGKVTKLPEQRSERLLNALIEIGQEMGTTTDLEELLTVIPKAP